MLSRDKVAAAYQWLLGREPEDEAALTYHMNHPSEAALRREILNSPEFAAIFYQHAEDSGLRTLRPLPPVPKIEFDAAGEAAERLWSRVAASWAEMGKTQAHWSVLTFDDFEPDQIEANRAAFEATAEVDLGLVDAALARFPEVDPAALDCLELGAGVGRATRALARRFRSVHGLDVSAAHLEIAAADLAAAGIDNVRFTRIGSFDDYRTLPSADFFYSRIVLQHNPPPVQAAILRSILERLTPGGIALFQVVTRIDGYSYSVAEDLDGKGGMEMHVLPQPMVFAILAETGMTPVEIHADDAAGPDPRLGSHLFLARKG